MLSDGKPMTVIRTKDDPPASNKSDRTTGRTLHEDSSHKDSRDNHFTVPSRQEKDQSKHKEYDDHVELRRLRSENLLLQERLSHMDKLMATEQCNSSQCIEQLKRQVAELAENEQNSRSKIEHLMARIEELQNIQSVQQQQEPVNVEIQVVQDELVASKLREAEAKSSFKELQQKFHNLERHWQLFSQETAAARESEGKAKNLNQMHSELKEQMMMMRIRETSLVSELNENRQKLMELETQNHIYERQTKRQETENAKLLDKITSAETVGKDLNNTIKSLEMKIYDLQSKQKEDRVMFKIQEAEFFQTAAELKRRIAELEIENQELLTSAQLHNKDQDVKELENRILELQDEILQMKYQTSDSLTAEEFCPTGIMTESFIGDNSLCLQPSNFDLIVNFSDCVNQTKLLDKDQ